MIVYGGWEGHTPAESAELFARELTDAGCDVTLEDTLQVYADRERMRSLDLVVPLWTMGTLSDEQWQGLNEAVRAGTGCAGFHGGIIDAFRGHTDYQWMTGGQWVAHPGNIIPQYQVEVIDPEHPVTLGIAGFTLYETEQYYVHVDPANHVLATTTFSGEHGDPSLYQAGTVMPYAWTKMWGLGRIFVACWGHTYQDFDVPEARAIVKRGMLWAMGEAI